MTESPKSKAELLEEIEALRFRVTDLQTAVACRGAIEERLRESEQRFRNIVESSPMGMHIYRLEDDGRPVFVGANPAADRILELDNSQFVGKDILEAFPGHEGTDVPEQYHRVAREGGHWRTEHIVYEDERIQGAFEVHAFQISKNQMAAMFFDITDRKRSEAALRESERRLDLALRGANLGLWDWNIQKDEVVVNERWAEILGYRPDEISPTHKQWTDLLHPEDRPRVIRILQDHLDGKTAHYETEHRLRAKSGQWRWVLDRGRVVERDEAGRPLRATGTHLDITDRKRAEIERMRMQAQIQQAQKLESLGVLAGGIAHDFNNLLMSVLGNADLALMDLSSSSPARPSLESIVTASRRAADLCRQMLAYSGKGKFLVKPVNLNDLVEEMRHLLEVSISKKVSLRYELADRLPLVDADVTQMRQIVMNLLTNASEAIGERSGVVYLRTGAMLCDRAYLRESYIDQDLPDGLYVYLEVSDTGHGMDEETRSRIFDPFFTTKFTGRGLGLAAVLGIMRGHRGAIKVYSEPRKGTTFKALFPASAKSPPATAEAAEATAWRGAGMALLVDDEDTVRAVARRYLERLGFQVLEARDGRQALELFREHHDAIAVVLLDLTMPHMDGEETFREMRRVRKDARVVLSSGFNEQEIHQRFAGKGLAGFIQKPYRYETLSAALRAAFAAE